MGGTFDPIHSAHLLLAEQAREQLVLDKVLIVPAGDPWRKSDQVVTPAGVRLEMVRLAVSGHDGFEVDDREVKREGATYTVDTLRELRQELDPEDDLFLILGDDALTDVPNWKEPAQLAEHAVIAVAPREGVMAVDLPFDPTALEHIDMPTFDVSSTDLRRRARLGQSLRYMVPDAVADFIAENGVYQD